MAPTIEEPRVTAGTMAQISPKAEEECEGRLIRTFTMMRGGQGPMLRLSPGSSWRGTIFNLINSMIGGGILGLPFAIQQCGLILGIALVCFIALLADISVYMIVYAADATRTKTLDTMAETLYDRRLGALVNVMIFLNNLGTCAGYVVILGDMLPSSMEFLEAPLWLQDRATVMLLVGGTVLLPLASLKSMSALSGTSLLCLVMISVFTVTLSSMGLGLIDVSHPTDAPARLYPQGMVEVLRQAPCILFAYSCHMNIPILYGELRRQRLEDVESKYTTKRSKMMMAMHISTAACCLVYMSGAVGGYVAFRDRIAHDVLLNLENGTFFAAPYIKMAYAVVIITSYPIMSFSCVQSFHGLLCAATAGGEPAKANGLDSLLLPTSEPNSPDVVVATPFNKSNVLPTESHLLEPAPYKSVQPKEAPKPSDFVRYFEVCFIVSVTLLIGVGVPDVSVVFGLTGGVCVSSLIYIFPSMFYLRLKRDERAAAVDAFGQESEAGGNAGADPFQQWGGACIAHAFFWGGLAVAIGSTTVVVQSTMG